MDTPISCGESGYWGGDDLNKEFSTDFMTPSRKEAGLDFIG